MRILLLHIKGDSCNIIVFTNPQLIMGLDMYFYGTKNFSVFPRDAVRQPLEKTFEFTSLINNHGMENAPIDYDTAWSSYDIKFPLMYWRKSNQIHKWFVDNVQGGKDNCEEYSVSLDQLKDLSKTIEPIVCYPSVAKEVIQEKMPTQSGFFFGSTEYDDYYFEDLRSTKEKIDQIISYQDLTLDAQNKRWHNKDMNKEDFEKHFPNLTKDVPFDDFYYYSSW